MTLSSDQSLDVIYSDLQKAFRQAVMDKKHPFRLLTLGTCRGEQPQLRTVVLREITDNESIFLYTDIRTPKIQEIRENAKVTALWYHSPWQLQIRMGAVAMIHHQNEVTKSCWSKVGKYGQRDYSTVWAPGSALGTRGDTPKYDDQSGDQHFAVIELIPKYYDVLQLSREGHLRLALAQNKTGDRSAGSSEHTGWTGKWLVP